MRAKVAALLTVTTVLSGCAGLTGDASAGLSGLGNGDVAARGGDVIVTVDDLADEVDQALASGALDSGQFAGSELEQEIQLQTLLLNNLLQVELATAAAADDFGIEVTDADVDALVDEAAEEAGGLDALEAQLRSTGQTLEQYRQNRAVVSLRAQITEAVVADAPLSEDDVRAAYEAQASQFEQVRARHILVPSEADAEAVLDRLDAGEDFSDLATELSEDTGSAQEGGSLGLAPRGSYVPEFEAAIWDGPAPVGEVLGPVETQFGFHLIVVDEFVVTPEDEALAQVRAELEAGREDELFALWVRDVLVDAEPEVAGRFGRWDEDSLSVVRDDTPTPQQ